MVKEIENDAELIQPGDSRCISYDAVRKAMGGKPYHMTLKGRKEINAVVDAVNIGIDSRLQACNIAERGDKFVAGKCMIGKVVVSGKLECEVSAESLPVLINRLFDNGNDEAYSLADTILDTLGFDDNGKFVGRDDD